MNYDRVILEMLDRIQVLEAEVARLKACVEKTTEREYEILDNEENNEQNSEYIALPNSRDTTKYLFDGRRYGKGRLVLAVVHRYASLHPNISAEMLMNTFQKDIQGSLGVLRLAKEVKNRYGDYYKRFFFEPNEIIYTSTDTCVVCSQWGKENIGKFLAKAEELGMHIQVLGTSA